MPAAFICTANIMLPRKARFSAEYTAPTLLRDRRLDAADCAVQFICERSESTQRLSGAMIAPLTDTGHSGPLVPEVLDWCESPQIPVEQIYKTVYNGQNY